MLVAPYVFFEGRCEEALNFYQKAVGAKVEMMMRYKDSPMPATPGCGPSDGNKIMHATLKIGNSVLLASDGRCDQEAKFQGFSLSLTVDSVDQAEKTFAALAEGGKVLMPLGKTFFSPAFGMLGDRYGVMWMIYVMGPAA